MKRNKYFSNEVAAEEHLHFDKHTQTDRQTDPRMHVCTSTHTRIQRYTHEPYTYQAHTQAHTHKDKKSIIIKLPKHNNLVYLLIMSGRLRKPKEPAWRNSCKMILRAVACWELLRTDDPRIRCASGVSSVQNVNGNPRHCRQITSPHT